MNLIPIGRGEAGLQPSAAREEGSTVAAGMVERPDTHELEPRMSVG